MYICTQNNKLHLKLDLDLFDHSLHKQTESKKKKFFVQLV